MYCSLSINIMKKLTYPVVKNGENVEIIFYIFADGISTNLASNWNIYGYFHLCQINDYLSSLIQFKEDYENHFQQHIDYNLLPSLLDYDIVSVIQKAYADNKLQFPNEKMDFIKTFADTNEMKLVAFQTENQELMKWFSELDDEKIDIALVANLALTDDMLALSLRRNPHRYLQFIDDNRKFSKQILDLLIEIDTELVSDLVVWKTLDENSLCYVMPYLDGNAFYNLALGDTITQYMFEFILFYILDNGDDAFNIMTMNHYESEMNFLTDRFKLVNQFK